MTDRKHSEESISKALAALEALSKGHSSRGTASTTVDSMGGEGGSTQIFHTASNSDPNGWAGSSAKDVPENGASDSVDANGTDLKGVSSGLMKSILEKVEKGQKLSEAETYVLKSVVSKAGMPFGKDKDDKDKDMDKGKPPFMKDDEDKDKDDKKKMDKSLSDHANSQEEVRKGLEMSPFLAGWANVQAAAHASAEDRIVSRLNKSLADIDASNGAFQAELAKSIVALSEVLTLQAQRVEQLESSPARGPKSLQAQAVEKSFGAGGAPARTEEMSKSLILDTMIDMVQKGKLNSHEVIKFDSTSELRDDVHQAILAHRSGR